MRCILVERLIPGSGFQASVQAFVKPMPLCMSSVPLSLPVFFCVWPQRSHWEPMMSHSSVWSLCITVGSWEYRAALVFQHTQIHPHSGTRICRCIKVGKQTGEQKTHRKRCCTSNMTMHLCVYKYSWRMCQRNVYVGINQVLTWTPLRTLWSIPSN